MSGISTTSGIFSGIDTGSLIQQLLAIEARPRTLVQRRIAGLQAQQAAYLDINSSLLALNAAAKKFRTDNSFSAARATSSNAAILTATANTSAAIGSYSFTVNRLVSTQQQISRAFADRDVSALGATEFSFEIGGGALASETLLSELNGGAGVERGKIRVTDSQGGAATIDLSTAVTVADVLERINNSSSVAVTARVEGQRIVVADDDGGALSIENVVGSSTATSLGIAGSATGSITSSSLFYISENTALSALNDGNGVSFGDGGPSPVADFVIRLDDPTDANDASFNIVLGDLGSLVDGKFVVSETRVATVGQLIDRINSQTGGAVTAAISADGTRITLTDTTGQARDLVVQEGLNRKTAEDLGLLTGASGAQGSQSVQGQRLLASINSSLASNLNGGAGVSSGTIEFTQRNGLSFTVDVDADDSVDEIISRINAQSAGGVKAALNSAGNGIRITDSSSGGSLIVADLSGTAAADLSIETAGSTTGVVDSGNLNTRWVSRATLLSSLNAGQGVGTGSFTIFDSAGVSAQVTINDNIRSVGDLINLINTRPTAVKARINDTGDGILLEDTSGGASAIRVVSDSGSVASRLGLLGESDSATSGENRIDGSFERTVSFEATDTLQDVANKINSAGVGVSATVINDGTGVNPYRLSITSKTSGAIGRAIVDTNGFDLGLSTLTQGRDAVVFFGSSDPADAILLTSSTNTLDQVISGVSIDLKTASPDPVQLTVSRDTEKLETAVQTFIDSFNTVFDRIAKYDKYDAETETRGALLGDSTVAQIRSGLLNAVQGQPQGVDGQFTRLFQVGVKIGSGGKLEFDKQRFREALEQSPQSVADLFAAFQRESVSQDVLLEGPDGEPLITTPASGESFSRLGVAEIIARLADSFTNSVDGLLTRRKTTIDDQVRQQTDRIEQIDLRLDRKRGQLEQQFLAMERAIASLQSQQASLGSLSLIG